MSERHEGSTDEGRRMGTHEQVARAATEGRSAATVDGGGDGRAGDTRNADEAATPGAVGALDGAAAAGSLGAVGERAADGVMPTEAPDPSIGPD